jgi:hypothetical protein
MIVTMLTRKIFVNRSAEKIHLQNVQDVAYMTYDVNLYSIKLDLLGSFFWFEPGTMNIRGTGLRRQVYAKQTANLARMLNAGSAYYAIIVSY